MKKYVLRIRQTDKVVFDAIESGEKIIETRAGSKGYSRIKAGDILVFLCEGKRLEKKVKKVRCFKDIKGMLGKIAFKKIMPYLDSIDQAEKAYYSFPNYEKRIKEFGLIAFYLE